MTLPPGQHAIEGFPRFGTHLHRSPPTVPAEPVIEICGAVTESRTVPLGELAALPQREVTADLHCVAGWSATNLHWKGVAFALFYRTIIEPVLRPDTTVTHLVFGGLDGYRSIVVLEDALADDVLIALQLDELPLDGDHGAPARLVSPSQYGFVSTKHVARIEVHTTEPSPRYHRSPLIQMGLQLVKPHRRARVWREERHGLLPAWCVRPIYRHVIAPIRALSARGSHPSADSSMPGRTDR